MYTIAIDNRGDALYHAESHGYHFTLGPTGAGANPGDTLLAAVCGCVGHYVRAFLKERGVHAQGFSLRAEAESTPDESRLARIAIFIGPRARLDAAAQEELLAQAGRCKIYKTLMLACPVSLALEPATVVSATGERQSELEPATAGGSCCG